MPTDRLYDVEKATSAWIDIVVTDAVVGMDAVKRRDENCSVARWLVCHWGGKYTECRPPPPPPPPHAYTHTNTHAVFLSEFLISLQRRIQDFGEEGVGSTWIIDASTTGRGAREARENFCGARSNFSTDCIGN